MWGLYINSIVESMHFFFSVRDFIREAKAKKCTCSGKGLIEILGNKMVPLTSEVNEMG